MTTSLPLVIDAAALILQRLRRLAAEDPQFEASVSTFCRGVAALAASPAIAGRAEETETPPPVAYSAPPAYAPPPLPQRAPLAQHIVEDHAPVATYRSSPSTYGNPSAYSSPPSYGSNYDGGGMGSRGGPGMHSSGMSGTGPRWIAPSEMDLQLIENRCRLKADGARWAVQRRRMREQGADYERDIIPLDREIIARAKSIPECFLWMCHPSAPIPHDLNLYYRVAGCFDALAECISTVRDAIAQELGPDELKVALDLLAEGQSALRASIMALDGPTDTDQLFVFQWLRSTAQERRVFIRRFMRLEDQAEPANWENLLLRTRQARAGFEGAKQREKLRSKLFASLKAQLSELTGEEEDEDEQWEAIAARVQELVDAGLPPNHVELREMLTPHLDAVPELDNSPEGFELALQAAERFLAGESDDHPHGEHTEEPEEEEFAEDSDKVAHFLQGRSAVLIGGERRPAVEEALRDSFRLTGLNWIESRSPQISGGYEAAIARSDVAVVMLAIRGTNPAFEEIREHCDRYHKPLVKLTGGYDTNHVARQILDQVGTRLQFMEAGV